MKMKLNKRMIALLLSAIGVIIVLWGIISQWSQVLEIVSFIFYGMVLAYILTPISRWMELY
ncbi:MAG TPA: hypothetical protein VFD57_00385, partial [Clostridia bacterium]|nr:hypothetical protein [Clostridia bacterium]